MEVSAGHWSDAVHGNRMAGGELVMARNYSIHATKLTLPHVLVLLGDELFIHYINFIYPSYDLYEYVTIDGITRVHRYFLERKPKPEPKPEKFDRLLTPLWTLQEIREQIKGD